MNQHPSLRTWLIVAAAVLGIGTVVACSTGGTGEPGNIAAPTADDAPAEPAADKPEPPAAPEPDGTTNGFCDYLLGDGLGDYSFAASIDVENTGNIGVIVEVWATFDQIGQDPIRLTDEVKVPVGETVAVQLDRDASGDEIDRHQSAGSECEIGGELIDTFGKVQD